MRKEHPRPQFVRDSWLNLNGQWTCDYSKNIKGFKKSTLNKKKFSKKINVQKSSISHILSGRNKPSLDFVVKLSDSFSDINIDWLINGEKSTTPTLNSDLLEKNNNSKKRVTKIVLFYDDKSFDTYEAN